MRTSLSNQKNTKASIRNLETQVGQIAKQLADQQSGPFSTNTQTNPKEHCYLITTRNDKVLGAGIGDKSIVGEERKDEEEKIKCEGEDEKNKKVEEKTEKKKTMENKKRSAPIVNILSSCFFKKILENTSC